MQEFIKLDEEKVFKDPVHRYVHVNDPIIWQLIGTREFQRLRRIKQLGTTFLIFHGAEQSRFGHSLGVYEITRRMLNVFENHPQWDPSERLLCLTAALLHDLGHGPFSHSFEKVFQTDHEEYTREIILGHTEVNQVLRSVDPNFPKRVADVIAKTYDNKLVVSMISSQIDADRMDYLLRDAYYTGVSYGHFDLERILRVMRPQADQVVIKHSGMHAVEDYIMSRYQMYWQVYFHPVTRSAEVILSKILHRAKRLYEEGYIFSQAPLQLLPLFNGSLSLEDYLAIDEGVMMFYFQLWQTEKDRILSDLCERFVNRKLFQYKEYNPETDRPYYDDLCAELKKAGLDPDYYLAVDSSSDLPYDVYKASKGNDKQPIHLLMPNGELRELTQESTVVDSISGKTRTDHKLYYPEDAIETLRSNPESHQKILGLLNALSCKEK